MARRPLVRLGARDRRALALGALVLAPALLWRGAIRPWQGALAETEARLDEQRELLARESALVDGARRYPRALRDGEQVLLGEAPRLFDGTDPIAATAALASYVGAHAYGAHVFLQGSETRAPAPAGEGIVAIAVDVRAQGDLDGILRFLRGLEDGPKLARVERLAIEREAVFIPGAISSGPPDEEVLTLTATVSGFALATSDGAAHPGAAGGSGPTVGTTSAGSIGGTR